MLKKLTAMVSALMLAICCATAAAQTDSYPNGPIKIVVPYPPGATIDTMARLLAEKWTQTLGKAVIVENKSGAGGVIAMQSVARAAPDGLVLIAFNTDLVGSMPAMHHPAPYDPIKDFAPIGTIVRGNPFVLAVNPALPIRNFADFVALAKSPRGEINFGTYGIGSLPHLGFAYLQTELGLNMVHVPYKGGAQSYLAAMSGEVQVVAGTSFVDLIKSGKLRGIAIGGHKRSPNYPDIPTFAELGINMPVMGETYVGLAAPGGTPKAVIDRLNNELKAFSTMPDVIERVGKFYSTAHIGPEELATMMRRDVTVYGPIVRKLGLTAK
ncbi:MAG TPA: tripartite tricarboxylate transporter substrate binding protein [Burkholderiaceae bacterium]|nr:tripartite tricarboxylate transporter substrate binding protein [Burkholderiaceae bacterium]